MSMPKLAALAVLIALGACSPQGGTAAPAAAPAAAPDPAAAAAEAQAKAEADKAEKIRW